jgi:hypothetical protein
VELDDSIMSQKVTIYRRGILSAGVFVALGGKKPDLWVGPTSRRRRPSGL